MQNSNTKRPAFRVLLLLLALCMVLSVALTACGDKDDGKKNNGLEEAQDDSAITGVDSSWNYGGETFTFYVGSGGWSSDDIWDDEGSMCLGSKPGEPFYDAVMARNLEMDEKYQTIIAITGWKDPEPYAQITTHLNADDDSFQAISTDGAISYTLAVENYLWDYNQWDNFDTSKDWWDQNFIDQLTINDHLYFLIGEYSRVDNQCTHAVAFNKEMCDLYEGLPSADEFYQMVKDGKWTIDKMIEYSQLVTHEVDGDGKMTERDCIGLVYRQTSIYGFLQGSGINIAEKGSDNQIKLTFYSDKTATLWKKLTDMANANYSFCGDTDMEDPSNMQGQIAIGMMEENRCMFFAEYMKTFEDMRPKDIKFGILPIPKYDEAQENYVSASHDYGTNFLTVPVANMKTEDTANILTLFAYLGQQKLTPAYYTDVLNGKVVKDLESSDMLDIIFDTKYYDLGTYMNWAGISKTIMDTWKAKSYNITSVFSSKKKRVENIIEKDMSSDAFASEL